MPDSCPFDHLVCAYCGRDAEELTEYDDVKFPGQSRTDAVWDSEGTLNPRTGRFACTPCYIKIGQPSSPTGWKVPDHA